MLALPALERAAARVGEGRLVIQVVEELAPLLGLAGLPAEILPLRRRHRVLGAAAELRARRPGRGVLLTPSFSAALIFRLAGVPERRGTWTDGRRWLLTEAVDRRPLLAGHRVDEFLALVDPGSVGGETPAPRIRLPAAALEAFRAVLASSREAARAPGVAGGRDVSGGSVEDPAAGRSRTIGLVPGGAAPSRRWPSERFGELARRRNRAGDRVLLFGGPADAEACAAVAAAAPGATDLSGRTDLAALAGGLASCSAVVSNDTGPMHLAAALERPVVGIFGAGDPVQTRPLSRRARVVRREGLPCVPCLRNTCPRRGAGYHLDRARLECLWLVDVDEVEEALLRVRSDVDGLERP